MKLVQLPRVVANGVIEPSFALNPESISWAMKDQGNPEWTMLFMMDNLGDLQIAMPYVDVKRLLSE